MKYQLQEGSFDLPTPLKDKSLNVFALNDEGANDYNLVISRADAGGDRTAQAVAQRLEAELGKALAGFQRIHRQDWILDAHPAVEVAYRWNNNGVRMMQRQTCVLVCGPRPEQPLVLLITATCPGDFPAKWNESYEQVLASFKLDAAFEPAIAQKGTSTRHLFVLGGGRLYVFAREQDARTSLAPVDIKANACAFYDDDGTRLDVAWDSESAWYLERTAEAARIRKLQYELLSVRQVQGVGELQDAFNHVSAVVAHLNRDTDNSERLALPWGRLDA